MRFLLALLCAWLAPGTALAFGDDGHAIVAEIGQRRLDPQATAMVARLLGPHASLASVSSWADEVRASRRATARWHYVNIPGERSDYVESRDCRSEAGGDCIVKALVRLQRELACAPDDEARRDALRFVVHLVADIHQPLHTVADLRGGNDLPVHGTVRGQACTHGSCDMGRTNLHAVWDSLLILRSAASWGSLVDRLEAGVLQTDSLRQQAAKGTPVDWALETHAVAAAVWNPRLVPADGALDDRYYSDVLPLLDRQLALAGLRLAHLLNAASASACEAPVSRPARPAPAHRP